MPAPATRSALLLAALAASAAPAAPARAQEDSRSIDVDRFRPTLDPQGFLTLPSTLPPGDGQWDVGLWLDYAYRSLVARGEEERAALEHRLGGAATVRYGLGDRVAAGLSLPFVLYQAGDAAALLDGLGDLPVAALGDARLELQVRALGPPGRRSRTRPRGEALALQAAVFLPTSTDDALAGERDARLQLRAIGDVHLFGLGAALGLGWTHRFEPVALPTFDLRLRDELEATLALQAPLPFRTRPVVLFEARVAVDAGAPFERAALTAVELDLAGRLGAGADAVVTFGLGVGLTDAIGLPRVRAFAAVHYGTRVPDADGDGVRDEDDACMHLPEDPDGFEDEDGCLDPDDDLDGIEDTADRCPNEPVGFDDDADGDGCPDVPAATAPPG